MSRSLLIIITICVLVISGIGYTIYRAKYGNAPASETTEEKEKVNVNVKVEVNSNENKVEPQDTQKHKNDRMVLIEVNNHRNNHESRTEELKKDTVPATKTQKKKEDGFNTVTSKDFEWE